MPGKFSQNQNLKKLNKWFVEETIKLLKRNPDYLKFLCQKIASQKPKEA